MAVRLLALKPSRPEAEALQSGFGNSLRAAAGGALSGRGRSDETERRS